MTNSEDKGGMGALGLLTEELKVASREEFPILSKEAEEFLLNSSNLDKQKLYEAYSDFIKKAQYHINSLEEGSFSKKEEIKDCSESLDKEFLPEFIEKHSLLLEELEGEIVDYRFKLGEETEQEKERFLSYVKSYLHNLKGDAGSLGLVGIEKTTHYFESLIEEKSIEKLLRPMISFKEWVEESMNSIFNGVTPQKISDIFICEISKDFKLPIFESLGISCSKVKNETSLEEKVEESNKQGAEEILESYAISTDISLLGEFFSEATEHLSNIEEILLDRQENLEGSHIDSIFRAVHSLKGASGYFKLLEMNKTSHQLENLLNEIRENRRTFDSELLSLSLSYIDLQKELIKRGEEAARNKKSMTALERSKNFLEALHHYVINSETKEDIRESVLTPLSSKEASSKSYKIKTFIKVDTERLDSLIEAIGEMAIYSNMLIKNCRDYLSDNETVIKNTHQVEKFSNHLQDIGMRMRLDPIKGLFQKMSRLVWDVSKKLNKKVSFSMSGEDTELDRTVIEKLADPLMHMVRNSIDHGIEGEEERRELGKPETGSVHLSAMHSGGNIHVLIKDDGRGLDIERLKEKAIKSGVIKEDSILSEQECFQLIFHPGLSTANKVTDVSGRGVGMDVVKSNIESMRGNIKIESVKGEGTTFDISLPLTLAIIDGIEVMVGNEHFIIPTVSVVEFIKIDSHLITSTLSKGENFEFRGKLLPLYRIGDLYSIASTTHDRESNVIAVVENAGEQIAILVDNIVGTCQTVIKNLGFMFEDVLGIAGCAIMSNGDIGLILDIRSLSNLARNENKDTLLRSIPKVDEMSLEFKEYIHER